MGQSPVCSICSEKEKEEVFHSDGPLIQENKNITLMDLPIIKNNKSTNSLYLNYIGGYSSLCLEGFNVLHWANDSQFKGNFENGVPIGWGIYMNPDHGTYKGEYEMGKPNGYGIYKHVTLSKYEGYWVNEKQEGYGIEQWKDGAIYRGEFLKGKKSGIGIYIFPNKNIYLGEWDQNMMNGYGIYSYEKNQLYMGQWANGLRDGYGEIYGPKNTYFFGYFRNNIKNGFFMFYNDKSKKIIIGYNNNGIIDGVVKILKPNIEPKLILVKKGKKIKEIDGEESINNYLNEHNDIDPRKSYMKDTCFKNYFFMKKEELEKILVEKCNPDDIEEINKRLGKDV
jgi:hypothetical protein